MDPNISRLHSPLISMSAQPGGNIKATCEMSLPNGQKVQIRKLFTAGTKEADIKTTMGSLARQVGVIAETVFAQAGIANVPSFQFLLDKAMNAASPSDHTYAALSALSRELSSQEATVTVYEKHDISQPAHLFLSENVRYVNDFISELVRQYPDKKEQLEIFRDQCMHHVQQIYGEKYHEWTTKGIDLEKEFDEVNSPEERQRQGKLEELLSNAVYFALKNAGFHDPENAENKYGEIQRKLAAQRRGELSATEKVALAFTFDVPTSKEPMRVNVLTSQYGDAFVSSIDKRDGNKPVPINAHLERASFNGTEHELLRTGSFDFYDSIQRPDTIHVSDGTMKMISFGMSHCKTPQEEEEYINEIRSTGNGEMVKALQIYLKSNDPSHPLMDKVTAELDQLERDAEIVETNAERLRDILNSDQHIGFDVPQEVREAFEANETLREELLKGKPAWGMISLQTPVNVLNPKGINKLIAKVAESSRVPRFIKKLAADLRAPDISELDSVNRELQGFEKAAADRTNCLYFNIPTNQMGKKSIIRLGPFQIRFRLKDLFNVGTSDKTKANRIEQKSQESTQKIYELTQLAIRALGDKIATEQDPQKKESLHRYRRALVTLRDQTFEITSGLAKFAPSVSDTASYETVGRLTVLMEMLNFNMTGHCRSGNNRTAAWIAKSHQILSTYATSADGSIPPPEVTGAEITSDNLKKNGSLAVFMGTFHASLTLQKANKGVAGTKERIGQFGSAFRTATQLGGFALSGRFDKEKFQRA